MASTKPKDAGTQLHPKLAAPIQRASLSLGAWTANVNTTPAPRLIADREMVIREIWFSADAVPADPDGTMLVQAFVRDKSEGAEDQIIVGFDAEAQLTVANEAKKAALAAETVENELTLQAGDSLRFRLDNNSAAIGTNANVVAHVLYQTTELVEG